MTAKPKPEMIVINCGTNDFKTEKDYINIGNNILGLAYPSWTDDNNQMISGIVPRNSNSSDAVIKANKILSESWSKTNK